MNLLCTRSPCSTLTRTCPHANTASCVPRDARGHRSSVCAGTGLPRSTSLRTGARPMTAKRPASAVRPGTLTAGGTKSMRPKSAVKAERKAREKEVGAGEGGTQLAVVFRGVHGR